MESSISVPKRNIVLLGKTGDGKSRSGNTIFGENVFTIKASASSTNFKCQRREKNIYGRKISVIDTPGAFDSNHDNMETKSEIIKYLIECAPAVHAFVVVIKVGRYTIQEDEVMQQVLSMLNEENVMKHTVILFTYGDELEDQTIEEFIKDCSKLQELVDKCGGRCHVIDNKRWNDCPSGYKSNRAQVKNLLETIDQMVKENDCYTSELLQKLEEEIQEEMKKNKDILPSEEIEEKAKEIVHCKYLEQFAGAATGALIGSLYGIKVALTSFKVFLGSYSTFKKAFATADVRAVMAEGEVKGAAAVGTGQIGAGLFGAILGGVKGGITGWKAAEDADSVCDAVTKAAKDTHDSGKHLMKKAEVIGCALDLQRK